jgi:hypothetical protein
MAWDNLIGKTIDRIEIFEIDNSGGERTHATTAMCLFFTDHTLAVLETGDPCCMSEFFATIELRDGRNLTEEQIIPDSIRHFGNEIDTTATWRNVKNGSKDYL